MDWKRKLCSRKLWLSIINFVTMLMIYNGATSSQTEQAAALIMAGAGILVYVLAEGWIDSKKSEGM